MAKLSFVVSLFTRDNDYQMAQVADAEKAARAFGVDVQIVFANNDSIEQSQQLLKFIQSRSSANPIPDGILLEPVGGSALPQVARAAAAAGIAWVTLNRLPEYLRELRKTSRVPAFAISCDHEEIGRIQGRQLAMLLPRGGSILYITGPSENLAANQRTAGMHEAKPSDVRVKIMKGQWTEESAFRVVSSWLHLSTSQASGMNLIAAQNDVMAMGARKAFQEGTTGNDRDRWLSLPFIGCDGVPGTGQAWVEAGLLAATVVMPPNAGHALELLVKAFRQAAVPPEHVLTAPVCFPPLDALRTTRERKGSALSAHGSS
jgi:ribose transport system substrate-binding protein